jgi:DNA-binding PadR family transcriptional regulator
MSSSFLGDGFAGLRDSVGDGSLSATVRDAFEQLRGQFDRTPGSKTAPRDVRAAILALLAEKPMYGNQIITEIEERSDGAWKPTAGSVYPLLQLLVDEGFAVAEDSDGRKTYALTAEGRLVAEAAAHHDSPWAAASAKDSTHTSGLPKAGVELARAAAQVGRTGNPEQVKQAIAVLDESRRKLYAILAQE